MCEALELKIVELEKEVTTLKRTNKLLRKKLTRLRIREENLVSEIEELDTLSTIETEVADGIKLEEWKDVNRCPDCGAILDVIPTGVGFNIVMCTVCLYRGKR